MNSSMRPHDMSEAEWKHILEGFKQNHFVFIKFEKNNGTINTKK